MGALSDLVAGSIAGHKYSGDFTNAVNALVKSISEHEAELVLHWDNQNEIDTRVFSSCSRLLLEQSFAILLGRLDPIRLVTVIKGSNSPDFKLGHRNSSSFVWNKDVLPGVRPGNGYWTQESIGKGIHRALLDGHLADYVFTSAHDELIGPLTDATITKHELTDWAIELLKLDRGEPVLAKLRILASEAYSTLSKGIHFEFFFGKETRPTIEEVRFATNKAIISISTVALYAHFSDISVLTIDKPIAISSFLEILNKFQHHG